MSALLASKNRRGLPGVSLVPCIPNVSRRDGNQVGSTGGVRVVILEGEAEAMLSEHAVDMKVERNLERTGGEYR